MVIHFCTDTQFTWLYVLWVRILLFWNNNDLFKLWILWIAFDVMDQSIDVLCIVDKPSVARLVQC